jgi:hypothetical protein
MGSDSEPMLDRLRHRATTAEEHFTGCRHLEVGFDVDWTIGDTGARVLLALGDAAPVELTAGQAEALAGALAVRAAKVGAGDGG